MSSHSIQNTRPSVDYSNEFDVTEKSIKDELDIDDIELVQNFFNRLKEEELNPEIVQRDLEHSITFRENLFLPSCEDEKCRLCFLGLFIPNLAGLLCGTTSGILAPMLLTNSSNWITGTVCYFSSCGLTQLLFCLGNQSLLNEDQENLEILKSNQNLQLPNLDDKIIVLGLSRYPNLMSYQQLKRARNLDPNKFQSYYKEKYFSEIQMYTWTIITEIENSDNTDEIIQKLSADVLQNEMRDHPIVFIGILQHLKQKNYDDSKLKDFITAFFREHLLTERDKKLSDDTIKSILDAFRHPNEICIKKAKPVPN